MKQLLMVLVFISILTPTFSQVYSNKIVGKKNVALKDSVKTNQYPYSLPIWGKKAVAKGYQLPYSAGISVNYFWQESDLIISNLFVGFNNGPMLDLGEMIRFDDALATASSINFRPDFWLFPFLNVYGLFGKAQTSTAISAGVWLPDIDKNWKQVSAFSTKAEFDAVALGFGLTPTLGVGGGWIALDMNVVWTDVDALDKPVFTFVFGPRVGKTFKFKNPDMNISGWLGGFRVNFSSETNGAMNLAEILPASELQPIIDQGFETLDATAQQVEEWWNGLTPIEQNKPSNKARYQAANKTLDAASTILTSADGALNDGQSSTVQYSLEKTLKDKWNFIIGAQFQINRHVMIRAEYGFLGSRQQFIGGLQYRFGL